MTINMGQIDRAIRGLASVVLLWVAFATDWGAIGWQHWALVVVGAVMGLTALFGTCPLYAVLGLNTCRAR